MVAAAHLLHCLLGMVLLLTAGLANAGTAYVFDGRAITNCSYTNSSKTYVCSALPLSDYQDSVEIASNVTLHVNQAVTFGFSQGLKMSGSARLETDGDLDISGIQSSLLQVSGGSLQSDGAFRMGALTHNITANINANDIYLGTGSTGSVTGTITAVRTVTIASNMTVTGNISGTVVTTSSPVKITGSVTASTSFTLASGSAMTGNINAPTVDLLASGISLTGNISSSGAVTLGSGNSVTGNVIADTLTLQDSNAYVAGSATVRYATLGYAGRVANKIYCTAGNTAGNCDCVANNSGYAINSTSGPSCPYMARSGAHHFQISHPVTGVTCLPSTVTITACANSACTAPHYTGGASVTLLPGNKTFTIGSSGVNNAATVEQGGAGVATIATSPVSSGMVCVGTGASATTSDCKISFATSTLDFDIDHHKAETVETFSLKALKSLNAGTCAPAFSGTKQVSFSCTYLDPGPVTQNIRAGLDNLPVRINSNALNCNGSTLTIPLTFGPDGVAQATMQYAEVGRIGLSASVSGPALSGSDSVIVAPATFAVENPGLSNIVTGEVFKRKITAKNDAGRTTVNFGRESTPESVTMSRVLCAPSGGNNGAFSATVTGYQAPPPPAPPDPRTGEVSASMTYAEAGRIDLIATLTSGKYLGSSLTVTGNTGNGNAQCSGNGNVGNFIPHHFDVAIALPLPFVYSGQPFVVSSVTARNHLGATTLNYAGDAHAKATTLTVHDSASGTVANPGPGAFRPALSPATAAAVTIAPSRFVSGVGTPASQPVYAFTNALTAPQSVLIRAVDSDAVSSDNGLEPTALIRRGRLRLFGAFGRSGADLSLPFRTEFWSGQSWVVNTDDAGAAPAFPVAAVSLPAAAVPATAPRVISVSPLTAGQGTLVMRPGASNGAVDFAVNLGLAAAGATSQNRSCLPFVPVANVGAELPWLRSLNGNCRTTYDSDPAARATFGVIAPERRRVIHVREVFR